jgi:hypothetical protein
VKRSTSSIDKAVDLVRSAITLGADAAVTVRKARGTTYDVDVALAPVDRHTEDAGGTER